MREDIQTFSNGAKHIALYCTQCSKHNGFKRQFDHDNEPWEFIMPIGKWKRYSLKQVDDGYLDWAVKNLGRFKFHKFLRLENKRRQQELESLND
jgi:hypothetical protein